MATFYVKPRNRAGGGTGDGRSYASAWNGIEAVDWRAISASNPSTLWVCGSELAPKTGVLSLFVEWQYSAPEANDPVRRMLIEIAGGRPAARDRELERHP